MRCYAVTFIIIVDHWQLATIDSRWSFEEIPHTKQNAKRHKELRISSMTFSIFHWPSVSDILPLYFAFAFALTLSSALAYALAIENYLMPIN